MDAEDFVTMLENAELRLAGASFRDALEDAGRAVNKAVEGNFDRQESSDGVPWAPHAPLTIALHGPHPLLRLTYDMFHAATNLDDPNAKKLVSDREIVFGVDGDAIPYARKQQSGAGRIPAREFFYLNEADSGAVTERFAAGAEQVIEREVLRP
jgi:hypothetical protein